MRRTAAPVIALLLLAACGDGAGSADGRAVGAAGMEEAWVEAAPAPPAPEYALSKGADAGAVRQVATAAVADSLRPAMLIRNGSASVEVAQLDSAVAAVRALAARLDGHVADASMQLGAQQVRQASLTLRIPAARFDDALAGLDPIGDVESVNVGTEDVGEQYTDLEQRLANARRLEERLLELLDTRTGELEDVLAVERELARVREEAERIEGRLRHLRTRVAMSTLIVTVHEPAPLLSEYPGQSLLLRSVRQAGRNFLELVAAVIASLGVVVPVALVLWGAWLLWRRRARRRAATARAGSA